MMIPYDGTVTIRFISCILVERGQMMIRINKIKSKYIFLNLFIPFYIINRQQPPNHIARSSSSQGMQNAPIRSKMFHSPFIVHPIYRRKPPRFFLPRFPSAFLLRFSSFSASLMDSSSARCKSRRSCSVIPSSSSLRRL